MTRHIHTICGQDARHHHNDTCPDPFNRAWHTPSFIPDRTAIAAWACSHTAINTAAWFLLLCVALAACAQIVGVQR